MGEVELGRNGVPKCFQCLHPHHDGLCECGQDGPEEDAKARAWHAAREKSAVEQVGEWPKGLCRQAALLRGTTEELAARHGIDFARGEDDGFGPCDEAVLRHGGVTFAVVRHDHDPQPLGQTVTIILMSDAGKADLEAALEGLGARVSDCPWVRVDLL